MNDFDFSKEEYETIKEKAMLNPQLSKILEMKIQGCSNTEIALAIPLSDRTLGRRLRTLKKKIEKVLWLLFFDLKMAKKWQKYGIIMAIYN